MIDIPESADIAEIAGMSRRQYFEKKGYNWEEVEKIIRLNRNYKGMVNAQEDEHHLVAISRYGSNLLINRKKMRRGDHTHHHDVFGIKLPHEQIEHVIDFNRKVLQPHIPQRIYDILDEAESRRKLYKPEVFNK